MARSRVLMWDTLASDLPVGESGLDIITPSSTSQLVELSTLFTGNAADCFFVDGVSQPLRTTVVPPGKKWTIVSSGVNYKAGENYLPAWVSGIQYDIGDNVVNNAVEYTCTSANLSSSSNEPPDATYWSAGESAVAGGGAWLFVKQDSPYQNSRGAGDGLWLNDSTPSKASVTNNNSVSVAGVKSGSDVAASTAPSQDPPSLGTGNRYWTSSPILTIGHAIWLQYGPTFEGDGIDCRLFIIEDDF